MDAVHQRIASAIMHRPSSIEHFFVNLQRLWHAMGCPVRSSRASVYQSADHGCGGEGFAVGLPAWHWMLQIGASCSEICSTAFPYVTLLLMNPLAVRLPVVHLMRSHDFGKLDMAYARARSSLPDKLESVSRKMRGEILHAETACIQRCFASVPGWLSASIILRVDVQRACP